ncbi:MAG: PAS domain S-box protein [Candidatus Eisenbacteria bacterium]
MLAGPDAESFARAILHSLPAHLAVIESDGRIVAVNKAWEKFTQEISDLWPDVPGLGENYLDALEVGRALERARAREAATGIHDVLDRRRARFEIEDALARLDGARWFLLGVTPLLGAEGGAVIAHTEITARKEAEIAVVQKQEVLQAVLESSAEGIVVSNSDGVFVLFNGAAREIAGVGLIESPPEKWTEDFGIFHPGGPLMRLDELPLYRAMQGESTDRMHMHLKNPAIPDGRDIEISGRPWSVPGTDLSGGVVVFRDITHEARIEEKIRFQVGVLDAVPNAVLALDPEGRIVYWNRGAEQLVGWRGEDLVGRRGRDVLLSEEERAQVDGIRAYCEGGGIFRGEFPARRPDGTRVPLLALASALRNPAGTLTGFVVVGVDLTDLRTTQDALRAREAELRQFQKMEAIGRLAGGVAHDFNNLLTVIRGYMDLLLARLPENEPARDDAMQVARAADRAAELTGQLLAFSRSRPISGALVDLNQVVGEFLPMLRRTLGENIEVVAELDSDLGLVSADAGQIGQVLLNLALNARDAMPEGGVLTVGTDNAELDAGYPGTHVPLPPGPYVRLSVGDTGIGMDEETRARVFEPFFTTKGPGQGTGLGLSTAYGIVRQHDGAIWIYSEPGHGTTVRLFLPRVYEDFTAPAPPPPPVAAALGGETILLVEDENAVRHVARRLLETRGYRVLEAEGGDAALAIARQGGQSIDLLLTDVIMPGMNGREVAEAVRALRPGLRVLYVSGHSGEVLNRLGGLGPGAHFLTKPFSTTELCDAVRRALDGPAGPGTAPS